MEDSLTDFEETIPTEFLVSKVISEENEINGVNHDNSIQNGFNVETEKTDKDLKKMETLELTEIKDLNLSMSEYVKTERSDRYKMEHFSNS